MIDLKKRVALIGVLVSLVPLGQPLLIGNGFLIMSAAVMFSISDKAQADSAAFYYNLGLDKYDAGDYSGAIRAYNEVIKQYPNHPQIFDVYINRGVAKRILGDYSGAIADHSKAIEVIEIDPRDVEAYSDAYYNRGNAKFDLKDFLGTISDYSKAIEINPSNINAYIYGGIAKQKLGDIKGACSYWRVASFRGDQDATKLVRNQC